MGHPVRPWSPDALDGVVLLAPPELRRAVPMTAGAIVLLGLEVGFPGDQFPGGLLITFPLAAALILVGWLPEHTEA